VAADEIGWGTMLDEIGMMDMCHAIEVAGVKMGYRMSNVRAA
jgi:hypothetical protein